MVYVDLFKQYLYVHTYVRTYILRIAKQLAGRPDEGPLPTYYQVRTKEEFLLRPFVQSVYVLTLSQVYTYCSWVLINP
jgi:hypothetical protein